MIGCPGETKENIQETYNLAFEHLRRYKTRPHLFIAKPMKGTELYDVAEKSNLLVDIDPMKDDHLKYMTRQKMIETDDFNLEYLISVFKKYRKNLFKNTMINWFKISQTVPKIFLISFLKLIVRIARNPLRVRPILFRYYIGKIIFPFSMSREKMPIE